jgi:hypothetical protein
MFVAVTPTSRTSTTATMADDFAAVPVLVQGFNIGDLDRDGVDLVFFHFDNNADGAEDFAGQSKIGCGGAPAPGQGCGQR